MQASRCVTIEDAARHVGLEVEGYRAAIRRGIFPGPIPGTKRYDLKAIDRRLDVLSGLDCKAAVQELSPYEAWKAKQNGNRPQARSHC